MKSKSSKSIKIAMIAAASSVLMTSAFAASIDGTTNVRIGGKVQSVDTATHSVTVINAQGVTESFQVGPNIPNLDKLKAGTAVYGTTARPVRLTVLESSRLAAVPTQDGRETVAQVTSVDSQRGSVTLRDTQGAELTVQANSPGAVAAVVPGTRVLVNAVNPAAPASGQVPR
ncbi:hypothetical protein [Caballeronia sordidicola]|jgi:hypothetical protein|uniref:Uncharacterized protein n=1 Tax=Caballeronia sordidicola TaxID=196367 RepID=A0A242MVX3_CABSO|nr:hypothetical protein [Caballeronia sordidicola]MDP9157127.1 hypothetical protein [Pseudomonadota bacterium]OTP75264.1 hypothetical protein PAMC26510_15085 [Caballeronia sordidicola]